MHNFTEVCNLTYRTSPVLFGKEARTKYVAIHYLRLSENHHHLSSANTEQGLPAASSECVRFSSCAHP